MPRPKKKIETPAQQRYRLRKEKEDESISFSTNLSKLIEQKKKLAQDASTAETVDDYAKIRQDHADRAREEAENNLIDGAHRGLLDIEYETECLTAFDFGGGLAHPNNDNIIRIQDTKAMRIALSEGYNDVAIELGGTSEIREEPVKKQDVEEKTETQRSDVEADIPQAEQEEEDDFVAGPPAYTYEEYEEEQKAYSGSDIEWKKLQRKRWIEGFTPKSGVRLTGIHYFYLTQIHIKNASGRMIRPIWRDVDSIIFETYEDCLKNGKDLAIFKRREVGLSSIFGAAIPLWTAIVFQGSTSLMTSADKMRVVDMFDQKFMASYNALEDWIRPKTKKTEAKDGKITFEVKDDNMMPSKDLSMLMCRQTSQDRKDATNLEGARAKYAFIDELFLHPYAKDVRASVESCLMEGFARVGICVFGGSAGHISRSGLKQAEQTWADRDKGDVECLFISGTLGIMKAPIKQEDGSIELVDFCENGHSNVKAAEKWIRQHRAKLAQMKDKTQLASFIKRFPLEIEEVFGSSELGALPEDIKQMQEERKKFIMNNPATIERMKIVPLGEDRYDMVNDPQGAWLVLEKPIKGERYIMGTDPIPMVEGDKVDVTSPDDTSLSLFASVIKRVSTDTYVAIYQRRVLQPDIVFSDMFGAQTIYNNAKNMIERNRADLFIDRYKTKEKWEHLADQPTFWGAKAYRRSAKKGWYKGTDNTEIAYATFFEYFRRAMDKVWFEDIIDSLPKFVVENTDILDAIVSCEIYHEQIRRTSEGAKAVLAGEIKYREVPYTTVERGKRVVRYRKVPIFDNEAQREAYERMMGPSNLMPIGIGK